MQKRERDKEEKNVHQIYNASILSFSLELNPLFNDFTVENFSKSSMILMRKYC